MLYNFVGKGRVSISTKPCVYMRLTAVTDGSSCFCTYLQLVIHIPVQHTQPIINRILVLCVCVCVCVYIYIHYRQPHFM
jgi:hypothetical protein